MNAKVVGMQKKLQEIDRAVAQGENNSAYDIQTDKWADEQNLRGMFEQENENARRKCKNKM